MAKTDTPKMVRGYARQSFRVNVVDEKTGEHKEQYTVPAGFHEVPEHIASEDYYQKNVDKDMLKAGDTVVEDSSALTAMTAERDALRERLVVVDGALATAQAELGESETALTAARAEIDRLKTLVPADSLTAAGGAGGGTNTVTSVTVGSNTTKAK